MAKPVCEKGRKYRQSLSQRVAAGAGQKKTRRPEAARDGVNLIKQR
jgi:hypothetical protein